MSVESAAPSHEQPSTYSPRTLRSDLQRRGRLPCDECLLIGLALATALDHLHRHGLVHRDIKPSNIVFVNGIPKLADIGLVTHVEATLSYVGTEGYLPPEGPGTPQADIFSLGKVLYEMATGRDRLDYPELPTNLIEAPAADLALLQSGKSVSRMRTIERRLRFVVRAGALVTAIAALAGGAFLYQQVQTHKARELARQNRQLAEEKSTIAEEKTTLADNLAKLGEENRHRLVRLDIANGNRLLDEGDPSAALLWFADALPLVTNKLAEESIHRIRIQQILDQTPRVLRVLPHESGLGSAAFSPDGQFLATGTHSLRVWNVANGNLAWGPKAMEVNSVRFSRDGRRLFVSSTVEQWNFRPFVPTYNSFAVLYAESGREVFAAGEVAGGISTNRICSHFSPDDRWLATSEKGNLIRLFDLADGRLVTALRGHTNEVVFLSFSADGSLLASASLDRTVRLWRLPSGEPVGSPLEHRLSVVRATLTGDGQRLITSSLASPGLLRAGENESQAWDVPNSRRLGDPIKAQDWKVMYVDPARPGRFYVHERAYSFDSPAEPLFRMEIGSINSWAFTSDGSRLALGDDYTARIFDTQTGALLAGPFQHGRWVYAVQFSPDEKLLLTAGHDRNVRL